ncbi:unnamed protein product [Fraxinus pennsylvanica]|uniref:Uncharacterized protein n=1 Tax=Fraxinus pennsylvanica TaxID=56036 RepID=A0AAD2EBI5_9LAMI|nr:unnamed protein product [Fraxinus pennsylvanica]
MTNVGDAQSTYNLMLGSVHALSSSSTYLVGCCDWFLFDLGGGETERLSSTNMFRTLINRRASRSIKTWGLAEAPSWMVWRRSFINHPLLTKEQVSRLESRNLKPYIVHVAQPTDLGGGETERLSSTNMFRTLINRRASRSIKTWGLAEAPTWKRSINYHGSEFTSLPVAQLNHPTFFIELGRIGCEHSSTVTNVGDAQLTYNLVLEVFPVLIYLFK